jgi:hypothetical protein
MNFDSYEIQILVLVAKNCRPNSPKPERAWWKPTPLYGVPEFGTALSVLLRDDLLLRKHGYRVRPSVTGYKLVGQWKAYRHELQRRPILFDRCMWDQPIELGVAA